MRTGTQKFAQQCTPTFMIKREFGLYDDKGRFKSYKALKRRYIYEAHELVDCYELPTYLEEQVRECNAQMNMEVA